MEKRRVCGRFHRKSESYNPLQGEGFIYDKNGNKFMITEVGGMKLGAQIGIRSDARFKIYGEISQEVLDFLPSKRFILEEEFSPGSEIPVRQNLTVWDDYDGEKPSREYTFRRKAS